MLKNYRQLNSVGSFMFLAFYLFLCNIVPCTKNFDPFLKNNRESEDHRGNICLTSVYVCTRLSVNQSNIMKIRRLVFCLMMKHFKLSANKFFISLNA